MTKSEAKYRFTKMAHNLRNVRVKQVMTKRVFEIAYDLGAKSVYGWESGEVVPNIVNFIRWTDALGYDVKLVKKLTEQTNKKYGVVSSQEDSK